MGRARRPRSASRSRLTRTTISASAGAGLWSPLNLGTSLLMWVDAMDAASITSGGTPLRVSQMNDKSGNGHHLARGTFSQQPNLVTGINGINNRPTLQFEASRSSSLRNTSLGLRNQPFTYALMLQTPASPAEFGASAMIMASADTGGGSNQRALLNYYLDVPTSLAYFNHFAGVGTGPGFSLAVKTNYLVTLSFNGASSSSSVNGTAYGPYNVGTEPFSGIELGGWNNAGNSSNVLIGEAFIANGVLSNANLQIVEGYLAWKWGTQGGLPANHPYKNFAPR